MGKWEQWLQTAFRKATLLPRKWCHDDHDHDHDHYDENYDDNDDDDDDDDIKDNKDTGYIYVIDNKNNDDWTKLGEAKPFLFLMEIRKHN